MYNRREWFKKIVRYGLLVLIGGVGVYLSARTSEKNSPDQCNGACASCGIASNCDISQKQKVNRK